MGSTEVGLPYGSGSRHVQPVDPNLSLARRAAVEDLPDLDQLWRQAGLPAEQLATFLPEFQVAVTPEGRLTAAVGLMVEGSEALLHSEALFPDPNQDEHRSSLWRRIMILARNQGIQRVWTQETGDFWTASGFEVVQFTPQQSLPSFVQANDDWFCCQLFDPAEAKQLVAEQMAVWQATRSGEAEELRQQIGKIRQWAFGFAALVILAILAILVYLLTARGGELFRRLLHGGR